MAIAYKPEALPKVSTFPFDISHWAGVNNIEGGCQGYEMADCKNMCSDNYPYASPRKSRKLIREEQGIQRIYKVEGDRVYYIDSDGYLCYTEEGGKEFLTYRENDIEKNIRISRCNCTSNYDDKSIFYPAMTYVDKNNRPDNMRQNISFGTIERIPLWDFIDMYGDEYKEMEWEGACNHLHTFGGNFYIVSPEVREISVTSKLPMLNVGVYLRTYLLLRMYDSEGNTKKFKNSDGTEVFSLKKKLDSTMCSSQNDVTTTHIFTIPEDMILEEGDYFTLRIVMARIDTHYSTVPLEFAWMRYLTSGVWQLERTENTNIITAMDLEYGTVYNNRIIGVKDCDIRASALGAFSNFYEYADEAGSPSATGAYATDVGSEGSFTGICVYNNMIMLFKKNIVYEMYGSMPYTIMELCTTGCIDNDSICEIGGILYWASPKGIVRYSGGVPVIVSHQVDIDTTGICKAGTDGRKYYAYDGKRLYVYDTFYQLWHIEETDSLKMFYCDVNTIYAVCDEGIYKLNSGEESVEWEFETKDYTFESRERKNLSKLWVRTHMERQSCLEVYVSQNGGEWKRVAAKTAERDEMFDFKLRVKKCDSFALKFKGKGNVKIMDIHGKVTVGTSKHRSGASLNVFR